MSHTMFVSSSVIPINQQHIHRHCVASITLERLCQIQPFRKRMKEGIPEERYIRLNNELSIDLRQGQDIPGNQWARQHFINTSIVWQWSWVILLRISGRVGFTMLYDSFFVCVLKMIYSVQSNCNAEYCKRSGFIYAILVVCCGVSIHLHIKLMCLRFYVKFEGVLKQGV